jgi:formylglycine-generating enzyme required for sulfatase activity
MTVIVNAGEFWMDDGAERHRQRIGRSFAVASKEVTVEQLLRFRKDHQFVKNCAPKADCPVNGVTWYDAAAYCNWLSEREGIPKWQWCYVGQYPGAMSMVHDYLRRTGYRLPTEAEWEFACRAGSETTYSFGDAADLLAKYAWFNENSPRQTQSVGMLRPNEYGLFDMHGNACEWTQSAYRPVGKTEGEIIRDDEDYNTDTNGIKLRLLRGGSFGLDAVRVRSAYRIGYEAIDRRNDVGFRPARTFTP